MTVAQLAQKDVYTWKYFLEDMTAVYGPIDTSAVDVPDDFVVYTGEYVGKNVHEMLLIANMKLDIVFMVMGVEGQARAIKAFFRPAPESRAGGESLTYADITTTAVEGFQYYITLHLPDGATTEAFSVNLPEPTQLVRLNDQEFLIKKVMWKQGGNMITVFLTEYVPDPL